MTYQKKHLEPLSTGGGGTPLLAPGLYGCSQPLYFKPYQSHLLWVNSNTSIRVHYIQMNSYGMAVHKNGIEIKVLRSPSNSMTDCLFNFIFLPRVDIQISLSDYKKHHSQ